MTMTHCTEQITMMAGRQGIDIKEIEILQKTVGELRERCDSMKTRLAQLEPLVCYVVNRDTEHMLPSFIHIN